MTRKWLTGHAPMYAEPNPNGKKQRDLTAKSIVDAMDSVVLWRGHPFAHVTYRDTREWDGWVYGGLLEEYNEALPKDLVTLEGQTPAANDAEQFVVYNGARQVNLCGQISAAYVMGMSLGELLAAWQAKSLTVWQRVFKRGVTAGGTGAADLISMFEAGGRAAYPLVNALRDPYLNRARYTPGGVRGLCERGQIIVSVRIDRAGRLAPSGSLHWVVVVMVEEERCGYGFVTIYNPFPNRAEAYSWQEFITSANAPYGVFIPEVSVETP